MQFAELADSVSADFFQVRIRSVTLRKNGGERVTPVGAYESSTFQISASAGAGVLDSGTTDTYLLRAYERPFQDAWQKLMGTNFVGSGKRYVGQLSDLPTILFSVVAKTDDAQESTIQIAFPPSHYMEYDPKRNDYTCRIYFDGSGFVDLGANFLMGHDVMFDVENDRVGFAESECDYSALVAEDKKEQGTNGGKWNQGEGRQPPRGGSSGSSKLGFCTGIGCRFGIFVVAVSIGCAAAALVLKPELRERLQEMMAPPERGLYQRTAVEIPMSNIDSTPEQELPEVS
eukprot:CAMPEP_0116551206 /NCGR_PEP_ID=MMETSP0397-20121206/5839_1 /TAXON_ID=216820 /ORGANISM="Cyclophora tenuis, Strain ECT3854" /LENGTH=286 /DNA_ID=CAMNT_0004076093 /DNA_START=263 /DNA_END=1123 /DNA_ORIENTATION=+